MPDAYEPFRDAIRARGHVVNPWRLGYAIGEAGQELPNPYTTPRGAKLFREGLKDGLQGYRLARNRAGLGK